MGYGSRSWDFIFQKASGDRAVKEGERMPSWALCQGCVPSKFPTSLQIAYYP